MPGTPLFENMPALNCMLSGMSLSFSLFVWDTWQSYGVRFYAEDPLLPASLWPLSCTATKYHQFEGNGEKFNIKAMFLFLIGKLRSAS